ncbi:MAG: hypothetical protein LUC93_10660 [Planctomycetaceae bacterium]|nr:hypothetical protein [Planctomycetaceae bacterium]
MSSNDDKYFDVVAVAQDTAEQLDRMVKSIPGEIRLALTVEYQRSQIANEFRAVIAKADAAATKTELAATQADAAAENITESGAFFAGVIRPMIILACVACIAIPLVVWGMAHWQTGEKRKERDKYQEEVTLLKESAAHLRSDSGRGLEIERAGENQWLITLPPGSKTLRRGQTKTGQYGVAYRYDSNH